MKVKDQEGNDVEVNDNVFYGEEQYFVKTVTVNRMIVIQNLETKEIRIVNPKETVLID